jgi:hypothetical protein
MPGSLPDCHFSHNPLRYDQPVGQPAGLKYQNPRPDPGILESDPTHSAPRMLPTKSNKGISYFVGIFINEVEQE